MQKKGKGQSGSSVPVRDAGVVGVFVGALAVMMLVACYVVYRLAGERAYREKWKDYNDCGWA